MFKKHGEKHASFVFTCGAQCLTVYYLSLFVWVLQLSCHVNAAEQEYQQPLRENSPDSTNH